MTKHDFMPFTKKGTFSNLKAVSLFRSIQFSKVGLLLLFFLALTQLGFAQDLSSGVTAIEEAATGIAPYFSAIETLVYVIAGIIALIGGVRVYMLWNMGDSNVMSSAAGWFGSAVFLLVAITFIRGFFGL